MLLYTWIRSTNTIFKWFTHIIASISIYLSLCTDIDLSDFVVNNWWIFRLHLVLTAMDNILWPFMHTIFVGLCIIITHAYEGQHGILIDAYITWIITGPWTHTLEHFFISTMSPLKIHPSGCLEIQFALLLTVVTLLDHRSQSSLLGRSRGGRPQVQF